MPLGSRGVPRLGPGRGEDFEPGLRVAGEVRAALLERCGNVLLPETGGPGGIWGLDLPANIHRFLSPFQKTPKRYHGVLMGS